MSIAFGPDTAVPVVVSLDELHAELATLSRAQALYLAKARGRNRVEVAP